MLWGRVNTLSVRFLFASRLHLAVLLPSNACYTIALPRALPLLFPEQKLWTNPANFRAFKVLIAAEYNGIELEIPEFNHPSDSKSPEFLAKSPLGRVPVLETPQV